MIPAPGRLLDWLRSELERRLLGLTAEEIRYTIDDVRAELRATRAELLEEIAKLRAAFPSRTAGTSPCASSTTGSTS